MAVEDGRNTMTIAPDAAMIILSHQDDDYGNEIFMSMQENIGRKLRQGVPDLLHLEVINESGRHNVPPGSESHFKVVLVSGTFEQQGLLARHRMVNQLLADELAGGIHALAIHAYTREEWAVRTEKAPFSPPCLGGSKTDSI